MRKFFFGMAMFFSFIAILQAQEVKFEEYDLDNGLHVILQQDHSAPVVTVGVMYHVGAKDEDPGRTGFAHFFEHLMFEGTKHIPRGAWFKIVTGRGGQNNANTTDDRTYYYEVFPSNNLETGLWMEGERMGSPVINQIGVDTQNEVVKEEKRLRVDNRAYGHIIEAIKKYLFVKHPYRHTTIGKMEDLDAATLDEFIAFNKKFYIPNNAVLVVSGDFDKEQAKKWIKKYFGNIPRGKDIKRPHFAEDPIKEEIKAKYYDKNIQLPALLLAYRTPGMKSRDAYVLDMISTLLSSGESSRLYKRLVDKEKKAMQIYAFNMAQEDYGAYIIFTIPMGGVSLQDIKNSIDDEIKKLQTELISEREYEKLQNIMEKNFVNSNATSEGIAHSLANYYMLYGNTNLINDEIKIYRSITREEIQKAAQKYLAPNARVSLEYLPEQKEQQEK